VTDSLEDKKRNNRYIRNIIFDLGNVLVEFNPDKYLKSEGLDDKKAELVRNKLFLSKEWAYLDRGIITREEARKSITSRNKECADVLNKYMNKYPDMFKPIDYNIEILKGLKYREYRLYFLSNFHEEAFLVVCKRYDFFKLFDSGIISAQVKSLKPESLIYLVLVNKVGIIPKESVFIDDNRANIETAKTLGFNTIHLKDPAKLGCMLKNMNVLR